MSIEFAAPAALVQATLFGEFRVRRCARNKPVSGSLIFAGMQSAAAEHFGTAGRAERVFRSVTDWSPILIQRNKSVVRSSLAVDSLRASPGTFLSKITSEPTFSVVSITFFAGVQQQHGEFIPIEFMEEVYAINNDLRTRNELSRQSR